jgi:hypothetical protein
MSGDRGPSTSDPQQTAPQPRSTNASPALVRNFAGKLVVQQLEQQAAEHRQRMADKEFMKNRKVW